MYRRKLFVPQEVLAALVRDAVRGTGSLAPDGGTYSDAQVVDHETLPDGSLRLVVESAGFTEKERCTCRAPEWRPDFMRP